MNILGFLYGLREAEMKSCLWQPEAPDTALSSQAWHDELLRLLSEPGGFARCCCCCRGLWGRKSLQIPLLGLLKSPWPSSSCPDLQLLTKGLVQHLGRAGWTCARRNLTGESVVLTHSWSSAKNFRAGRFSISPQPCPPGSTSSTSQKVKVLLLDSFVHFSVFTAGQNHPTW